MDDRPIRAAINAHIKDRLGSYEAAAEQLTGVEKSQLQRYADLNGTARIPLVVALELDMLAGEPSLIRWAASKLNCRLVPFEARESVDGALDAVCDLVAKVGPLVQSVREKAADRKFTPSEIRDLHREIAPIGAALSALVRSIGGDDE